MTANTRVECLPEETFTSFTRAKMISVCSALQVNHASTKCHRGFTEASPKLHPKAATLQAEAPLTCQGSMSEAG